MRKHLTLSFLSLCLISCGGGSSSPDSPQNPAPKPINTAPVVNIAEVDVSKGLHEVVLDASGSTDNGSISTYQWNQISGGSIQLVDADTSIVKFTTSNSNEQYVFEVKVTDNEGLSTSKRITIENKAYFTDVVIGPTGQRCATTTDSLYCWQGFELAEYPDLVSPSGLSVGKDFACVIDQKQAKCFGTKGHVLTEPPVTSDVSHLVAGNNYACAIDSGEVKCWGSIDSVPGLSNVKELAAGPYHACAISDEGVNCWGTDEYVDPSIFNDIPAVSNPQHLAINDSGDKVCIVEQQELKCWGSNIRTSDSQSFSFPVNAIHLDSINSCAIGDTQIHCWRGSSGVSEFENSGNHSISKFAITTGMACFELNESLQCFGGRQYYRPKLTKIASIKGKNSELCATSSEGVTCWGGVFNNQTTPPAKAFKQVISDHAQSCGVASNRVECWGAGTLPEIEVTDASKMVLLDGNYCVIESSGTTCGGFPGIAYDDVKFSVIGESIGIIDDIGIGYSHYCALKNGTVTCQGNDYGSYQTLDVPTMPPVDKLFTTYSFNCAIADKKMYCWGTKFGSPIAFPSLVNVEHVALSDSHGCAIADNKVECWGEQWQLGPVTPPPGIINPRLIATAYQHSCVLDDNGIYCWGKNDTGQTHVPEIHIQNPTYLSLGTQYSCVGNESDIQCWGYYGYGENRIPADFKLK